MDFKWWGIGSLLATGGSWLVGGKMLAITAFVASLAVGGWFLWDSIGDHFTFKERVKWTEATDKVKIDNMKKELVIEKGKTNRIVGHMKNKADNQEKGRNDRQYIKNNEVINGRIDPATMDRLQTQ